MESTQRDLTIPIFILCIVFMIGALSTYIYFENSQVLKKTKGKTMATSTPVAATPPNDIYPLYPTVAWNEAQSVVTKLEDVTFHNFEITSKPIQRVTDISKIATPFKSYYDEKLKLLGWSDGTLHKKGPASLQWTYKKGMRYIILSYVYEQEKKYTGGAVTCPCRTTFTILTGGGE